MFPNYATSCRSYFTCENGRCREDYCRPGTLFDSITSECFENAYCHENHTTVKIQGRAASFNIDCRSNQGQWYADENDCTKFFVCAKGRAYRQQCLSGQYFDSSRGVCLSGSTGSCQPEPAEKCSCSVS